MAVKQRLQRIEQKLQGRVRQHSQTDFMERFVREGKKGRVLCSDGVSRSWEEWVEYLDPSLGSQVKEVLYHQVLEAVKKGETITPDIKKFMRSYLKPLCRNYRKEITSLDKQILDAQENNKWAEVGVLQGQRANCEQSLADVELIRVAKISRAVEQGPCLENP